MRRDPLENRGSLCDRQIEQPRKRQIYGGCIIADSSRYTGVQCRIDCERLCAAVQFDQVEEMLARHKETHLCGVGERPAFNPDNWIAACLTHLCNQTTFTYSCITEDSETRALTSTQRLDRLLQA